jgi:hypothetical protein
MRVQSRPQVKKLIRCHAVRDRRRMAGCEPPTDTLRSIVLSLIGAGLLLPGIVAVATGGFQFRVWPGVSRHAKTGMSDPSFHRVKAPIFSIPRAR